MSAKKVRSLKKISVLPLFEKELLSLSVEMTKIHNNNF